MMALGMSLLVGAASAFAVGPGPVGSEFEVDPSGTSTRPRVFPEAGGTYVVLWNGAGGGFLRRYDATGAPVAPASGPIPEAGFVDVSRDAGGNFVLAQGGSDGYSGGVFGQRLDAAGTPLAPQFQVNMYTGGFQGPGGVGVAASGEFLIVWDAVVGALGRNDVYARAYDAGASPVGGEFLVNGSTTEYANASRAIADGAGNFVVAWIRRETGAEVFARRFGATGAPLGPEFQVNTYTTGHQSYPHMAAVGGGAFIVVWQGQGLGDTIGVFGQRFDATGTPVGGEFAVNTYLTGLQVAATVAVGGGGEFVVSWQGQGIADGFGVSARRFDGAGVPLGPEFQVNTYTEGGNMRPRAVLHPGGDFTVVWDSDDIGIRGQRFDATGAPVPGEVPVGGKRLLMRNPPDPSRRRIVFGSSDPNALNGINPLVRPDVQGMYLHVYNSGTGDSACLPLPASNWDPTGDVDDLFFYRDTDFVNGPCRLAKLRRNKSFTANCRGSSIAYTLDEPTQGSVAVAVTLGPARYCTVFGGTVTKDSGPNGIFRARNSIAPASCPAPPVPCP